MKEQTWDKKMGETLNNQSCKRAEDLVAYLYGEASEAEAQDFISHLHSCTACRAELSTFGDVREAIGIWREQAFSPLTSVAVESIVTPTRQTTAAKPEWSMIAALRDFFTLSPMWVRGATVFATLLLAALMIIGIMRFLGRTGEPVVVETPSSTPVDKEDVPKIANTTDNVVPPDKQKEPRSSIKTSATPERQVVKKRGKAPGNTVAGNKKTRRIESRDLSREERTELADLLILHKESEDAVPRLSDLLGESNY